MITLNFNANGLVHNGNPVSSNPVRKKSEGFEAYKATDDGLLFFMGKEYKFKENDWIVYNRNTLKFTVMKPGTFDKIYEEIV